MEGRRSVIRGAGFSAGRVRGSSGPGAHVYIRPSPRADMDCCPYCGAGLEAGAGFCGRCGEPDRTAADHERGWLHPASRQYCEGIAHGARSVDPDAAATASFRADLAAALEDLAALDGLGEQRRDLAPIDPDRALAAAREAAEPDDLEPAIRGLLVALAWLADLEGPVADDLLAQSRRLSE